MRDIVGSDQILIELSIKHRNIFQNAFTPCIEAKKRLAKEFLVSLGCEQEAGNAGYSFCDDSIAKVANILLLKKPLETTKDIQAELNRVKNSYIPVPQLSDTISRVAYSISINRPCLIRGISGSGKSSLLEHIAASTNRISPPDFVNVQIGDQLDSKLLIGSYVCTDIPGQFEWQPGPLTKAMVKGSWIVFEDIDSAPSDMAQVIHSVLENCNLSAVPCCPIKLDQPHPEFRIFFTQRTKLNKSNDSIKIGFGFIEKLCDIIEMPILQDKDLSSILEARYHFGPLTAILLKLYQTAEQFANEVALGRAARPINYRDLFKLCERLSQRNFIAFGGKFSAQDLEYIFLDALDCFASHLPCTHIDTCATRLGEVVNLSATDVRKLTIDRLPQVKATSGQLDCGRVKLSGNNGVSDLSVKQRVSLAFTKQTLQLIERIAQALKNREPVLLVGETGVGKTSIVQCLADFLLSNLVVINLSQQSDSSDLLGGFKPVDFREIMRPLHSKFEQLFQKTFDEEGITKYMPLVTNLYTKSRETSKWGKYLKLVCTLCSRAFSDRTVLSKDNLDGWKSLFMKARKLSSKITNERDAAPMALAFSEGTLLKAVKDGHWILLDEINLAEPEVLQCLISILDSMNKGFLYLQSSNNQDELIRIHNNFRVFACMNPSTDVGKKDLPPSTRGRFTELFVEDITDKVGVRKVVNSYVKSCLPAEMIEKITEFYLEVKSRAKALSDISGNTPVYSLRTLCRALTICSSNICCNMERSLFESLKITFLQQLNEVSSNQVLKLVDQLVFAKKASERFSITPNPMPKDDHNYILVENFWIQSSNVEPEVDSKYILTSSVRKNLESLSRIISLSQRRLPILIQGKTSVGKTSLITYLAKLTGNKCYRINNHEHTDLQEYVGRYVLKENGELVFQDGLLVRALRKGYWIILDELNLAPCELLEALNRVLDDNRELFIPDTRETVKAHAKFMLFATQNPPEDYAGRKLLSRAFRNRFIELHFDDIPIVELEEILHRRCEMPLQYSKKIVAVMRELQCLRRESSCFNGRDSFMTMRDLFRWGERYAKFKSQFPDNQFYDWDRHLASEGLILLEGRVRTLNEADTIKLIIEKIFKCQLDRVSIYYKDKFNSTMFSPKFAHIHFTLEFQKLFTQLSSALRYNEPVLLCGQTGCGKTTACQLYADTKKRDLITYNCHLNTESSDFIGSIRPSRCEETNRTFTWVDGPLVEAMKRGGVFLMDEISLADDAVIERLNSVLEPTRSVTLTEKDGEEIYANESFRLVATMNPGGDYGKKELSPALRNRFTEIYCHNTTDIDQILKIIESSLARSLLQAKIGPKMLPIMQKFLQMYYHSRSIVSVRDVINWAAFLNRTTRVTQPRPLSIQEALLDGVALIFFDQFGTCGHDFSDSNAYEQQLQRLKSLIKNLITESFGADPIYSERLPESTYIDQDLVKFGKFFLSKGPLDINESVKKEFVINTPNVRMNLTKIVRAMQLDRPILLEGDPGAGKTSVVAALAKLTGNRLIRINLSEQTDISDLFGSDLPSSEDSAEDEAPHFCWHDGPMLRAIKESDWILLDEMNLASQSVLEGLNACLDHRGEIYIPELNKSFSINRSTSRIFACQNPYQQGAARKGLPQSFLNRFTSIYIKSHSSDDLIAIIHDLHPCLSFDLVRKIVEFNTQVSFLYAPYGYEFNLRDILYWCDIMMQHAKDEDFIANHLKPDRFVQFAYLDRIRTSQHRMEINELFEKIFEVSIYEPPYRDIRVGEYSFVLGRSLINRKTRLPPHLSNLCILKCQLPYMESLAKAIELNKMPILVGETGVGKRSIVKILAGLTGHRLHTIGANSEMDTVELLGSFEQRSIQRSVVELVEVSKKCITSMLNSTAHHEYSGSWTRMFHHIWATLYATHIKGLCTTGIEAVETYALQLSQMKELIETILPLCSNIQCEKNCTDLLQDIDNLAVRLDALQKSSHSSGSFEWIDSLLVRSIVNGDWVMIENANLLNPATLDRLNSLVEPGGTLTINEKGIGKFGVETLTPHLDFRLILTMDPSHGELSRAMRNRGIEIFMQTRFFFEDFLILLNRNGFEPEKNKACMTYCIMQTSFDAHLKITEENPVDDGSLLTYFGLNYITSLAHQVRRGVDVSKVLSDLLITYYAHRGFIRPEEETTVAEFIMEQMGQYEKKYVVNFEDERYKWRQFRFDLMSMSGCDAIPAMLDKEHLIFYDEFNINLLLKTDELVEHLDIVNTSIAVKIFLELATHGDFEYRRGFIREIFLNYPKMMEVVNKYTDLASKEYVPIINALLPSTTFITSNEMQIDTRNSPELHYYLQALNYSGSIKLEQMQNRWLLSLHRIMLNMIVDLIERRTIEEPGHRSLYLLSELVQEGKLNREDLIRPHAEIAFQIHELLDGLLQIVSNRCYDDNMVEKLLPKLFWIIYFICKLKRGYNKTELIATCNQIPMLWALTYQKVIEPLINDCDLNDIYYKEKKLSARIEKICEFLDVTLTKPSSIEKSYYSKVLNAYASTSKFCESIAREVDKFFTNILSKYTARTSTISLEVDLYETRIHSSMVWSNSVYSDGFYRILEDLIQVELPEKDNIDGLMSSQMAKIHDETQSILNQLRKTYQEHEENVKREIKNKVLHPDHQRNALDQFSPVWQLKLLQTNLSKLDPVSIDAKHMRAQLQLMLKSIDGIIMSPRYYCTVMKFFITVEQLRLRQEEDEDFQRSSREITDMYSSFLLDHLLENVVLDNQVVGWTKLRVTTCDLPSQAPLLPEYSPILTLVSSYCLDITHLKLNAHNESSHQLDSMIVYLWKSYVTNKLKLDQDLFDMKLAETLMRYRLDSDPDMAKLKANCGGQDSLVELYVKSRLPLYEEVVNLIREKLAGADIQHTIKALKLIYFGYLNYLEYAPIFTLDPSLRSREKLEVYRSELAHIKLDLHVRNTLFYWKTGENLQLNEVDPEDTLHHPLSVRILVNRRHKLEKSINRLRREHINRPKSDDGSLYYELRKDIEVNISRYTQTINMLINDLIDYMNCQDSRKIGKFSNLITKCRMIIKNLEKTVICLKSEYSLYSDLTTNFLVGLCFVQQGLRCLYARLEQKMQVRNLGFCSSIENFSLYITRVFSFSNLTQGTIKSVIRKLHLLSNINKLCPAEEVNRLQSLVLKTVLVQLNHHIMISPSDIKTCIPIVKDIAGCFHKAWLDRKNFIEEQRRKREELYEYKSTIHLNQEISYQKQEFLNICANFPTYDHIFQPLLGIELSSADEDNLKTEEKVLNLNRSVDLAMCIDICKAHFKFIREASRNLLGQLRRGSISSLPEIDLMPVLRYEAETLYTLSRHCVPILDSNFDSLSLECHLLQAVELSRILKRDSKVQQKLGSLQSSIEILDEEIFDIYHHPNSYEALKFQDFINKLESKVAHLLTIKNYDDHINLISILQVANRISSFLITDPLMKFVTGAHALLDKMKDWNQCHISKEDKLYRESEELVDLIKNWRNIEIESWKSSLHHTKRKYIDGTLCDLWFQLYEYFNNPTELVGNLLRDEQRDLEENGGELLYLGFALLLKNFIEDATHGDYQIRLDLVFSFVLQTRFAGIYENSRRVDTSDSQNDIQIEIDYDKLTTYAYNVYRQYLGLFEPIKDIVEAHEAELLKKLNTEIRVVAWQNRNILEIKDNFRISHRKLNKVMSLYLEFLRSPIPGLVPTKTLSLPIQPNGEELDSDRMRMTLIGINLVVANIAPRLVASPGRISALRNISTVVEKIKEIYKLLDKLASSQYINNLVELEEVIEANSCSIKSFYSHKVHEVIIQTTDTKESKDAKYKLCRQMHNSKKFSLQSIFTALKNIGSSFRRGLNIIYLIDNNVLSVEPLRGMIQNQSKHVLEAAAKLVDDSLIETCNNQYRKLVANFMFLMAHSECENLSHEQFFRVKGYSIDLVADVIRHNKSSALIYRHLMSIQAVSSRLSQLELVASSSKEVRIYNFVSVHKVLKKFNELVGRAYLATLKLEELCRCSRHAAELLVAKENGSHQGMVLPEILSHIDQENSLLTVDQLDHIEETLPSVRRSILEISENLKDALNNTIRNHLFCDDDLDSLDSLYCKFMSTFGNVLPNYELEPHNMQQGTALHALKQLLEEARSDLHLDLINLRRDTVTNSLQDNPDIGALNLRLYKLVKNIKLATQSIYKEEEKQYKTGSLSEADKRRLRPFNRLDSFAIVAAFRLEVIAKSAGDCFVTLNRFNGCTGIQPIVECLTPVLSLYTQTVACYLNIILSSLNLRLNSANQLIPFFIDIVLKGFGLPNKMPEFDDEDIKNSKPTTSEDNAGFGEGQGDTDVSKKLEFESQLDELRRDDQSKDKSGNEQTEPIEAHDDGVEMQNDLESDAFGPDAKGDTSNEQSENDDDESESMNDLDKMLDTVDQDEEKLDNNLWGDDEPPEVGEDDENDIREAESDPSLQPKVEDTAMQARDENLEPVPIEPEQSNQFDKNEEVKQNDQQTKISEQTQQDLPGSENDLESDAGEQREDNEAEVDIDLEKDAELALKEAEDMDSEKQTESLLQNEIDMSLSDDESAQETQEDQEAIQNQIHEDSDKPSNLEEAPEELPSPMQTSTINDDDIDTKLEHIVEHPHDSQELPNLVEEHLKHRSNIHNTSADVPAEQQNPKPVQGRKVGLYTVYDIINEEEELSYDSEDDIGKAPQDGEDQGGDQTESQQPDKPSSKSNSSRGDGAERDVDEKQEPKSSSKRTHAEHSDEKEMHDQTKRQKILDADESSSNKDSGEKLMHSETIAQTRHILEDRPDAVEVVDLVSSSDDDAEFVDAESDALDQTGETKLRNKSNDNLEQHQDKSKTLRTSNETDEEEYQNVDNTDRNSSMQDNRGEESESSPKAKSDDLLSSISSIGSGQLSDNEDAITQNASRDLNTSYNTNLGLLKFISLQADAEESKTPEKDDDIETADMSLAGKKLTLMERIDNEVNTSRSRSGEHDSVDTYRLTNYWLDCTRKVRHLEHELCQQLQIVLQPTKMSKYKGDYKTGKRLNMRKIISYIASHYRKDKIWLRRTKPSKRTYNIALAVDNSLSMAENDCRQMTYQSLALLAKSLSIIEAGSLSVVSFGEKVKCIHEFGNPYVDAIGAQWLRELRFNETRTSCSKLLEYACNEFAKQALRTSHDLADLGTSTSQLLIILSDGRNISHEEDEVRTYLRQLKSLGVLTLFVVIDNPGSSKGGSIVDVKRFLGVAPNLKMVSYMELFPFPFYVLLRQLDAMPSILGDALRQWFELVSQY